MNRNPEGFRKIFWLNCAVFLSAFLLFQIELIIAKIFLPKFGGSYLVWGACMVFFQGALLLGYYYSHLVIQKLGMARYRFFHVALVFLPLLFFPGRHLPAIHVNYHTPVVINIFWQLLISVGLAFFVLSTTSVIFQGWLAASDMTERSNPYILYATSNLGSFAALLTYPLLFEAYLNLHTQLFLWRLGYLLLAALNLAALKYIGLSKPDTIEEAASGAVAGKDKLSWLLLSAAGTIIFLSVTNIITYEITPFPLLWIIPLSLYLLSFVLNFKKEPWCPAWITEKFHLAAGFGVILFFLMQKHVMPLLLEIAACFFLVFIVCMFCSYRLNRSKPVDNRHLTTFYLIISFGGFLGGMFITWILPLISTSMIEYLIGFLLISMALAVKAEKTPVARYHQYLILYLAIMLTIWPEVFPGYNFIGMLVLFAGFGVIYSILKANPRSVAFSLLVIVGITPFIAPRWSGGKNIYTHRNYYGIYKVREQDERRFLFNGTTIHGGQCRIPGRQMEPITYYHPRTPIYKLMKSAEFNFRSVGVVGLGTGTMAVFAGREEAMDFFEIDPDVYSIATKYFTFLTDSPGKINFVFADARLALANVKPKYYDLLVIDAFSGDSIPMHLLTTEAIAAYRQCITDSGIVVFHISNRYLDLSPVIYSNAREVGAYACIASNARTDASAALGSQWAAYTWDRDTFEKLTAHSPWQPLKGLKQVRPWTDEYSNIIPTMRLAVFMNQVKNFKPFYWDFGYNDTAASDYQYYRTQANEYAFKKDFKQAIAYYQKVLTLSPDDAYAYFGLGKAFGALKQYAPAIACYKKGIAVAPGYAPGYVQLGSVYAAQGLREKALQNFKTARELFEENNDSEGVQGADELIAKLP